MTISVDLGVIIVIIVDCYLFFTDIKKLFQYEINYSRER